MRGLVPQEVRLDFTVSQWHTTTKWRGGQSGAARSARGASLAAVRAVVFLEVRSWLLFVALT